jgi:hypothetical protein
VVASASHLSEERKGVKASLSQLKVNHDPTVLSDSPDPSY